jgi:hypothetical protein
MSLVSTGSLLIYLVHNNLSQFSFREPSDNWYSYFHSFHWPPRRVRKIYKNEGYFWLVNLFISSLWLYHFRSNSLDFIQSIGMILCVYHWARGYVAPGLACNVQGVFINSGHLSSAVFALVIGIHTWRWSVHKLKGRNQTEPSTRLRSLVQWVICIGIWAFVIIVGTIGFQIQKSQPQHPYYCTSTSLILFNIRQLRWGRLVLDRRSL